jgi:hypothetical protein
MIDTPLIAFLSAFEQYGGTGVSDADQKTVCRI